jgi:DNA-binding transcriptional ArsR family regulator
VDEALRALADPTRRQILGLVRDRDLSVNEIAARFPMSRPAVSQHLAVLKLAGLVSVRKEGTRHYYRARRQPADELVRDLERMWDDAVESDKISRTVAAG